MKRKKVEAWTWIHPEGVRPAVPQPLYASRAEAERHTPFMHWSNGYVLTRLVPADPAKEAVYRAAVKWWHSLRDPKAKTDWSTHHALKAAVERATRRGK